MKKQIFFILGIILMINLVSAITIDQIFPTTSPFSTTNSSVNLEFNITNDNLTNLKLNWNGVNYTFFDNSLVLNLQANNFSALGEWFNSTGCKAVDVSMYGNNGTCVGNPNITLGTDRFGNPNSAFNFSGNLSYINVSDLTNNNFNTTTISLWVKGTSNSFSSDIIRKYESSGGQRSWGLSTSSSGRAVMKVCSLGDCVTTVSSSSLTPLNDSNWHFVTYTYDLSNAKLYIDGILEDNDIFSTGIFNSSSNIKVGSPFLTAKYWNGSIDNIMIFNKSLSALEVSKLYNSQITKYNLTNWGFISNQTSLDGFNYNYNICSSNSTNEVCSSQNIINHQINLIANFTSLIGNINNLLYGVNSKDYPSHYTIMNNSGTLTLQDYDWHVNALNEASIKYLRKSMFLVDTAFQNGSFITSGYSDIRTVQDMVYYSYSTGGKILLVVDNVPDWEQNRTSGYCNSTSWSSCSPYDNSSYSNTILAYINNVTNNGLYNSSVEIQIMNEIEGSSFLNNLTINSANALIKSIEYNKIYNRTRNAIKSVYPNMPVGMYSGNYLMLSSSGLPIMRGFLGNFSNAMDFFAYNDYLDYGEPNYDIQLQNDYSSIISNCTLYSANCSRILISEINIYNSSILNSSNYNDYVSMQIALAYLGTLNIYPNNISLLPYTWSSNRIYNLYMESYPYDFRLVSEPNLDNIFKPSYYILKNLATLCPAEHGQVFISSSTDNEIKIVTCKDNSNPLIPKYNIILINTVNETKNGSINGLPSLTNTRLYNIETLQGYSINDPNFMMDGYGILYLTEEECPSGYLLNDARDTCVITGQENACTSSVNALLSYIALLGLVGTILFFGWLFAYLFGFVDKQAFNKVNIVGAITLLILIGLLLIISIFIMSTLCEIF